MSVEWKRKIETLFIPSSPSSTADEWGTTESWMMTRRNRWTIRNCCPRNWTTTPCDASVLACVYLSRPRLPS